MGYAGCGRCHECGDGLTSDEWCQTCHAFRRYQEHGWGASTGSHGGTCFTAGQPASLVTLITRAA
jgi:hypothetical protein